MTGNEIDQRSMFSRILERNIGYVITIAGFGISFLLLYFVGTDAGLEGVAKFLIACIPLLLVVALVLAVRKHRNSQE